MANTPYLTQDRRDYISRHGLEDMVTVAVNNLMRDEPAEPASYLAKHFSGLADNSIKLQALGARQFYLDAKHPFLEIETTVAYKGQSYTFKYVHEMFQEYDNPKDLLVDRIDAGGAQAFDFSRAVKLVNDELLPFLKGKDLANLPDFDDKLLVYCTEKNIKFKNVTSAISFAALHAVASLYNRTVYGQLMYQLTNTEPPSEPLPLPGLVFRLFTGGPNVAPKFRPAWVGLLVNEESTLAWKDLIALLRRVYTETEAVIAKGKGGRDLVKCHLDGSYIPQFETVAEALKVVEEVFKTLNASEHFSLWVNFGAAQLWNKEQGKYEFENFKKPSDPEEVEDLIAKLLLDKKLIRVVQDPLILEHKFNWHRLSLKLKEKNHSVQFASSAYYSTLDERKSFVADVTEADFPPKTKNAAEMVSKINGAKAQITLKEVSFRQCFTCSEFIKRYADLGKIHSQDKMQLFITDPAQVLADDPFLDVALAVGGKFLALGSPLQQGRFLAYQKKSFGARPPPAEPQDAHEGQDLSKNLSSATLLPGKEAKKQADKK